LDRNIKCVIDLTPKVFLRAEGALDPFSFTYRHELQYLLKNQQLINKTTVLIEDGGIALGLPLEIWAKMENLRF
jgi:hypothetical protein